MSLQDFCTQAITCMQHCNKILSIASSLLLEQLAKIGEAAVSAQVQVSGLSCAHFLTRLRALVHLELYICLLKIHIKCKHLSVQTELSFMLSPTATNTNPIFDHCPSINPYLLRDFLLTGNRQNLKMSEQISV
jgi:hypothetical protein